ncbi:MAG TPA: membrane protein insertase YidC [Gemmatimonadaceae bacterium]|nr:membrane protein insertase YidC [Gemmatimonadaceae bacterium]
MILALVLTAAVVGLTPVLFPSAPRPPRSADSADSTAVAPGARAATPTPAAVPANTVQAPAPRVAPAADSVALMASVRADTTAVSTDLATYGFVSVGAAPVSLVLKRYLNLAVRGRPVDLGATGVPLLRYRLVVPGDTIDLSRAAFTRTSTATPGPGVPLGYEATVGGHHVAINYSFHEDSYLIGVTGRVTPPPGVGTGARFLLLDLPSSFPLTEADSVGDRRSLAYAFKTERESSKSVAFGKLDPGERRLEATPLTWVAAKSKYFVVGVLTPDGDDPFSEVTFTGGPRTSRVATNAMATVVERVTDEGFSFEAYAGPQEWERMLKAGREFDTVNPYGWKLIQGFVQPFARIVMRILLWMHNVLQLNYGWVLVIFGVVVRLILWPLNQKAMKSSLRMQHIQPRMQEVQKKYAGNREKQQAEMMKIYKEEGVSPFTALTGCLPMLLPMPVLIALFFVFQNTIEFRGVPFLWLTDISIKDPYYILPLLMGASMYLLSWIGLRNAPPNPQAKMMSYIFPFMMTFFLLNLAAGLNLYYAVQNVAALPQQWLIARERQKMTAAKAKKT